MHIEVAKVLSVTVRDSKVTDGKLMSSFKSTVEKIRALEIERRNLLLEIEELKRMADAKAKALESEINMLRDEVKSLRVLLSGEELETELGQKKKK
jgi:seryl-tRNA synthetase